MFYISYDGADEPLGRSQVVPYLLNLARAHEITLISFEKSTPSAELQRTLSSAGIRWRPLRYHARPPVLSTLLDVVMGRRTLLREARGGGAEIIHVRSYVPALIAVLARRRTGGKLLFDIRGFWADERVDGRIWRPRGSLYRVAKRAERRFFAEADAVVTLTQASVPQVVEWTAARPIPIEVIPTCADIERFANRPARPGGRHLVWCGSVGTWYRLDLAAPLAAALELPLTVLTRQADDARRILAASTAAIRSVAPERLPEELFAGDIGLCLYRESFSRIASAPTRFAEYLAAGMPSIVTPGIGDLGELVERYRVGVVLRGEDSRAFEVAAREMRELLADPDLSDRCRRLASERFDVDRGSAQYAALYRDLISG